MRVPRFRFGLRTMFVLTTLFSLGMGYFGVHLYKQYLHRQAITAVTEAGGTIMPSRENPLDRIHFGGPAIDDAKLREIAQQLRLLPEVRELDLVQVRVTDEGVEALSGLVQLEELFVFDTQITPAGMKRLGEMLPDTRIRTSLPNPTASKLAATRIFAHALVAMSWSPEGKLLATGSGDGTLRLWDFESKSVIAEWQAHDDWTFGVAFSPSGRILATGGGDNVIRLWDFQTQSLIGELAEHAEDVHALAFTPDGTKLVSASDDWTVRVWDVARRECLLVLNGHQGTIPNLTVSPNGKIIASASRDNTVKLWSTADGKLLATLEGHIDDVMAVDFSAGSDRLATASYDGTLRLWDLNTFKSTKSLAGHQGRVFSVAFDPAGENVVSSGVDGVRIWQLGQGTSIAAHDQEFVSRVGFTPDGEMLVSINAVGELRLLSASSGQTWHVLRTLYGERGIMHPLATIQ